VGSKFGTLSSEKGADDKYITNIKPFSFNRYCYRCGNGKESIFNYNFL